MSKTIICPKCGKEILKRSLTRHNIIHRTPEEFYNKYSVRLNFDDDSLKRIFLTKLLQKTETPCREDFTRFNRYVKTLKSVNYVPNVDFFFETVIPWHLNHPNINNDKTYFYTVFSSREIAEEAYNKCCRSKNPFVNHKGRLSPFSKKFIGYEKDDHEQRKDFLKRNKIAIKNGEPASNKIEYWLNKGFSLEEAKIKLSERQRTFTLEKCIQRYGKEEGTKKYYDRQKKWQAKLLSKDLEEIKRINRAKASKIGSISKQEKFIKKELNLNEDECQKVISVEKGYVYDFCVGNKIIEFNGDYWHCNPKIYAPTFYNKSMKKTAEQRWKLDEEKNNFAKENGYQIKIVWEYDLKNDPEKIIKECREFLSL